MKERSVYPCGVDMKLDCPTSCKFYMKSVRTTLRAANQEGMSPEEYVMFIREIFPEDIKEAEKRGMIASLQRQNKLQRCQRFSEGKIYFNPLDPSTA